MISDPVFYLCAIPAILIFGMAKGGFGGGISVIAVPLMALTVTPLQAAAILLPILVVMDMVAVWRFRGQWDTTQLRYTLPGAILGVVVGAFTFRYLSEDAVRLLIGVIVVVFCLNHWLRRAKQQRKSQGSAIRGNFWGSIAGFTSFGIHQGGPPISIYMLPLGLEKRRLMGTFALFFAIVNLVKLIPYAWLGQFTHTNLMTSLMLLPLAPVGVQMGYYLLNKVDEAWIYRICYVFLFVVGLKLVIDGFMSGFLV